jgi:drug/metabolite transporter (DMT)-like permease
MIGFRTAQLTAMTMVAFAANSLLCRVALRGHHIDAVSFTLIRLLSGALFLWVLVRRRGGYAFAAGSWASAIALFGYAIAFSYAYVTLPAAAGALLLFGAVQATMIGFGFWRGERLRLAQWCGLLAACGGLVGLLAPGLSAPPIGGALLMIAAGVGWGVYSLRGRGGGDAIAGTAGNFIRACAFCAPLALLSWPPQAIEPMGVGYALASGVIASGLGYVIWYTALASLRATSAAVVQLSVPVLAALGAGLFLGEPINQRLIVAAVAILGGIAIVILARPPAVPSGTRP